MRRERPWPWVRRTSVILGIIAILVTIIGHFLQNPVTEYYAGNCLYFLAVAALVADVLARE